MKNLEINQIREMTKLSVPTADFDGSYTFYYDETNNIRKFHVREFDFNSDFTKSFVLGGLVHQGATPDVQSLIDCLKLEKDVQEVKFKYIAKGDFLKCLKSNKLKLYLEFIKNSELYIHYSSLNLLYWSIADIVDSAIVSCEASKKISYQLAPKLKNDLYQVSKLDIDLVIELFRKYEYPNIKQCLINPFIEELSELFQKYLNDPRFHFGLECLRQILKQAKKQNSLPFVMGEEDFILIENFTDFYLRPTYLFKNSTHVFDKEDTISEILHEYRIFDGSSEIKNFSFVDSQSNQLIQLSDVIVGLIGKLHSYLNISSEGKIDDDFSSLSGIQEQNIDLLLKLIDKSYNKNIGFLHAIDSYDEQNKFNIIRLIRNKI